MKSITIPLAPANWRTTIVGAVSAALLAVEPLLTVGTVSKERLIVAGAIGLLGYLAKDAGVSGTDK